MSTLSTTSPPIPLIGDLIPDSPLIDSRELIRDPQALRARYARDGYLYLARFFDPEPLLRARADILDICRQQGWLASGSALMDGLSDGVWRHEGDEEYRKAYRQVIRLPSFNACSVDPKLLRVLRILFGCAVMPHPRNIARIAFPGGAQPTQPHQDFHYIRGSQSTVTTWIPTADVPADLGGLGVLAGSHLQGFVPHERTVGAGGFGVPTVGMGPWHGGDFTLGDVLLFHSHTIHAARRHRDPQRIRLSFDFRYQPVAEPIDPSSLCYHGEDQPRLS